MKYVINLEAEFGKVGITNPSEQLLDAAMAAAEQLFIAKPALTAAFNSVYGTSEKRRAYTRKNTPTPENNHA